MTCWRLMVGIEVEVEALQALGGVDGGAAQAEGQLLLGTTFDFIFDQAGQEFDVGPLAVHGLLVAGFQGLQNAGEPQLFEMRVSVGASVPCGTAKEMADQFAGRTDEGARRCKNCGCRCRQLLLTLGEDALDRHVAGVVKLQGTSTRCL